jgi:hypothetical protein
MWRALVVVVRLPVAIALMPFAIIFGFLATVISVLYYVCTLPFVFVSALWLNDRSRVHECLFQLKESFSWFPDSVMGTLRWGFGKD